MSSAHQQSSSVTKSQRSYGLFIEEGQVGRYNPLPEAMSELWPPEHLVSVFSSACVKVSRLGLSNYRAILIKQKLELLLKV